MKVEFLKSFSKDLDDLKVKSVKQNLLQLIELLESEDSLENISNLKKLKGHRSAYRIRIGDYRLGFFVSNSVIILARFLHRKSIYKIFP
jgi:mRNA interferase RelE/StbE